MDRILADGYVVRRRTSRSGLFVTLCAAVLVLSSGAWGQGIPVGVTGQHVVTRFSAPGGEMSHPTLAEHKLNKSIQESATSVGSYVGEARATPGSVGSESYLGYIEGLDLYGGSARADSATVVAVTGPAGGTATILIGGQISGGMGIFGSDAHAASKAWFSFSGAQNVRLPDGSTSTNVLGPVFGRTLQARDLFWDKAAPDDDGNPTYDYSPRHDLRLIDVPLDANGDGEYWIQLTLVTEAYEDGEEELIIFAAASDFLNTVNAFLEPMDASVSVTPASDWRTKPFGTTDPFDAISPAPRTVDVSGITSLPLPPDIGIPEPTTAVIFMTGMVFQVIRRRSRRRDL